MRIVTLTILVLVILPNVSLSSQAKDRYLYRAEFIQAAPGKLLELIDLYKARFRDPLSNGGEPAVWMRHSQGDHWDLLLLFPMVSYTEYYGYEQSARREAGETAFNTKAAPLISWREDIFVYGPPISVVKAASSKASFFHVEIFQSLSGKQSELYREREMENAYQRALHRPENLIFVRDQGGSWDLFTIGFYRDLKHYAESADVPEKDQEAAAKLAGFEGASRIGPYLRTLISTHHDTLAVAVR
jgi:hypothetical protein